MESPILPTNDNTTVENTFTVTALPVNLRCHNWQAQTTLNPANRAIHYVLQYMRSRAGNTNCKELPALLPPPGR